ncbi:NUDIX hydrolase [Stackebrandtia soli]|uniref:NUDIX hydrolase n=1 Tax=Stackebrandtia soli TaxID=1892856 RepID=UPI0039E9EA2E
MPTAVSLFAVTVHLVVLTVRRDTLSVLLDRDGSSVDLMLPGGYVDDGDLPRVAARELADRTGTTTDEGHLEQLATYGDAAAGARQGVISVAYLALLPGLSEPTDAASAWYPVAEPLDGGVPVAFDHRGILGDGVERARAKLEYSSLAAEFCPEEFTIAQLRRVYEVVWGARLDPRNFHRKVTGTTGFVEPTDRFTDGDRGRPARLYHRGPATALHPALLRR